MIISSKRILLVVIPLLFPTATLSSPIPVSTPAVVIDVRNLVQIAPKPDYTADVLKPLYAAEKAQHDLEVQRATEAVQKRLEWLASIKERVQPYGTYNNNYSWGNCTLYVASRISVPDSMGNARNWGYSLGYNHNPTVGAIAWSNIGWAGHVAIVEQVDGDQVLVSEMNVQGLGVIDYRWTNVSDWSGFIY